MRAAPGAALGVLLLAAAVAARGAPTPLPHGGWAKLAWRTASVVLSILVFLASLLLRALSMAVRFLLSVRARARAARSSPPLTARSMRQQMRLATLD